MDAPIIGDAPKPIDRLVESGPVSWLARTIAFHRAKIFMLHRFSAPEIGVIADDPDHLRRALRALRRQRVGLMSLRQLVMMVQRREPLRGPTAVFTVDDGYIDFECVVAPVFAEFDCPVTVFVTSEVTSGRLWFWWDKISYVVLNTRRVELTVEIQRVCHSYPLGDRRRRMSVAADVSEMLKQLPDADRSEVISRTARTMEVEFPESPPVEFRAMDWTQVRRLEQRGVEFGPHSKTHPIIGREDDARAREEIHGSWSELQRQCRDPSPVFCYPNGTLESFSARDMQLVISGGMAGAVALYSGAIDPRSFPASLNACLPRRTLPSRPERTPFVIASLPHFARRSWRGSTDASLLHEREREARAYAARLGKAADARE